MNISIQELKRKMKLEPLNLIDIRSFYDYQRGTISGAVFIPKDQLLYHSEKYLKKGEPYYLLCDSGVTSLRLSKMLCDLGYQVYSIEGGYRKYLLEK